MSAISYTPSNDELYVEFRPLRGKPIIEVNSFKLWWDKEGNICAIAICPYSKLLEEFKKSLRTIKLGGIWKNIRITDKDIKEARKDLLKIIEEKW